MVKTKQQKRAEFALETLKQISPNLKIDKKLSTFIVGMPTMILSNGLGQTMAYLMAKKDKEDRKETFYIINKYLCATRENIFGKYNRSPEGAFNCLMKFTEINQKEYVEIQEDVLRMLEWLKRYARAFSEDKEK